MQPGGGFCCSLEIAWGGLRRACLRAFSLKDRARDEAIVCTMPDGRTILGISAFYHDAAAADTSSHMESTMILTRAISRAGTSCSCPHAKGRRSNAASGFQPRRWNRTTRIATCVAGEITIARSRSSLCTPWLPTDGTYYVHIGDIARHGGEEYGYRLRISAPQPDFALRVVPSSVALRSKNSNALTVYAIRKDGFAGPIKLTFKDLPPGFTSWPVVLSATQAVGRLTLKTDLVATTKPINLTVAGTARIQGRDVTHEAVPAEDRMQAFLWRHLVPATDLKALVFDPNYQPPPKRVAHARPRTEVQPKLVVASADSAANKPKFTKQQVTGRLRQLKLLFEEGLLTDDFYNDKVGECEAGQLPAPRSNLDIRDVGLDFHFIRR